MPQIRAKTIPPCCCMGSRNIVPTPYAVLRSAGATGLLAYLNDGVVLPHNPTASYAVGCFWQCSLASPSRAHTILRRRIAANSFEVMGQLILISGGFKTVRAIAPILTSFGCASNRSQVPAVIGAALPAGTTPGSIWTMANFRTLKQALTYAPNAATDCT